jgi:hypothetical protein
VSKGKAGRAETVHIPYAHISRLDFKSNAYSKAMKIIEKTNPTEAVQAAAEPNSVHCKHHRANSFVKADPRVFSSNELDSLINHALGQFHLLIRLFVQL